MTRGKVISFLTWTVLALSAGAALVLMFRHAGLIEGLDFGAGQYYYTDIPGWERFFSVDRFHDTLPRWIYFVLFFLWGWLMYRLWVWIDRPRKR